MDRGRSRRGGAVGGILVGIGVVLLLAVAAAVGVGLYIASNVRVEKARNNTTIETPFGSMRVREGRHFDAAQFGAPVYPGAERQEDSRKLASFEFDFGDDHTEFSVSAAEFTTTDPVEKVAAFYHDKLPKWMYVEKHRGIQLELNEGGQKRIIAIRRRHGVTHIGLASIGEPAAN
jgi:hypothetical protein